jgi:uncharacterized repeat protein (TIGR02543 family)
MKLNSKGYMLVEIIVAAVIAFSIAYYLLNLIYNFKDKYDDVYESINLYSAKINVTKNIMNDLVDKTVSNIEVSGSQCESNSSYAKFNVSYIDSSGNSKKETRKLEISRVNNKNQIIYGKVDGNEYDTKDESYYSKEFSSYIEIKCPNNGYFKNSGLVKIPISSIYDNNQYDINLFLFSNNSINLDVNGGSEWTSSTCKNESLNDGINFQDTNKLCNKKIILGRSYGYLPIPLREGYNFDGWYTEQNGGDEVGESTKVDSYRDSLYAHWKEKK